MRKLPTFQLPETLRLLCTLGVIISCLSANALAAEALRQGEDGRPQGAGSQTPGTTNPGEAVTAATPRGLLLITLDTTRADHLGSYRRLTAAATTTTHPSAGSPTPVTPHLDALAARGTLYRRALTTSPLTLPAHASLLTALDPPQHGLRDNGVSALAPTIPTLASELSHRGFQTAAFVGSRVLDRRFGLAQGFAHYDDQMPAEQIGEYGYPERDAAAVVDAALAWLGRADTDAPWFLWLHFYDPHAPYQPPAPLRKGSEAANYGAEITFVDQQIGRFLGRLPMATNDFLLAVVGDHGESLGEHDERTHGLLLYRGVLEVPMILAGPGIGTGRVIDAPVSIRQVAPTLLDLLQVPRSDAPGRLPRKQPLPGIADHVDALDFVYSETWMPATAYGWSPLVAITQDRWRLVVGPRPELFDYLTDPMESTNLVRTERRRAGRLRDTLESWQRTHRAVDAAPLEVPADLAASLRSLGYVSGQTSGPTTATGGRPTDELIDPKDGLAMLAELSRAKELLNVGNHSKALPLLESLVDRSPGNVPFLSNLASAQMAADQPTQALATLRRAVELNPHLDFLHLHLAEAHRHLEQWSAAEREYRLVIDLNPRQASAWLSLAEILYRRGDGDGEYHLLQRAVEAETHSASVHLRLAQLEESRQGIEAARRHLRRATDIAPTWPLPWLLLGKSLRRPDGDPIQARAALEKVVGLAPRSREAQQARQLLQDL